MISPVRPSPKHKVVHSLWADSPAFLAELPRPATAALIFVTLYALGFATAWSTGIAAIYLRSPAFVLGSVGVAWCWTTVRREVSRVDSIYDRASLVFCDQVAFTSSIEHGFARTCNPKWHAICAGMLILPALAVSFVSFFGTTLWSLSDASIQVLRPWLFAPDLYQEGRRMGGFVIVSGFAVVIGIVLGLALWLGLSEIIVVRSLRELAVKPVPEAVRALLRPIANLHVRVARDWAVGIVFFVLLFGLEAAPVYVAIYGVLVSCGVAVFFVPQVFLADVVQRSYEHSAEITLSARSDWARIATSEMAEMIQASTGPRTWVYGSDEVWGWIMAQSIAISALLLQIASLS